MRYLIMAVVTGLITFPSTLTAQDVRQVKYQRWGMFGGYKDKSLGQNSWKVIAGVNGRAPEGSAFNIALYRAAELSKMAGFKYFQIINQKGKQSYVSLGGASSKHSAGGDAELQIIAVNDPSAPENCLAQSRELCMTLEVDATMQRVSPFLRFARLK